MFYDIRPGLLTHHFSKSNFLNMVLCMKLIFYGLLYNSDETNQPWRKLAPLRDFVNFTSAVVFLSVINRIL